MIEVLALFLSLGPFCMLVLLAIALLFRQVAPGWSPEQIAQMRRQERVHSRLLMRHARRLLRLVTLPGEEHRL
jgi:hypothetical protein